MNYKILSENVLFMLMPDGFTPAVTRIHARAFRRVIDLPQDNNGIDYTFTAGGGAKIISG